MTHPRRALLSVSDKTGIEGFARRLADAGFELLSTGGTAQAIRSAGLNVTEVADVTGLPEMMGGRVKTLHPAIHGPILARRTDSGDMEALEEHGYRPIDVVAVNLYPFRETVARGGVGVSAAMEQVDIGGPTMIRAAAKNHAHVWVVVDPEDYPRVVASLAGGRDDLGLRRELAAKVFRHISGYDAAVAQYLGGNEASLPELWKPSFNRSASLRYGENPDQDAGFYVQDGAAPAGLAALGQLHGKALSYNNLLDLDGALLALSPFAFSTRSAVCIVKHTTPCGLAIGDTVGEAFRKALRTDPVSAFGSVIATNRTVYEAAARSISELFVECVVAPRFSDTALDVLREKKNVRLLEFPERVDDPESLPVPGEALQAFDRRDEMDEVDRRSARFLALHGRVPDPWMLRGVYGGLLVQTTPIPPFFGVQEAEWRVVTERAPSDEETSDLAFAWSAIYGVKSNAILLARSGATLGIGAGQMSRVDASRLAVQKAQDQALDLDGSSLASDAFFPFRDGVEAAARAGIRSIVQPGGSIRDAEVIDAANEAGVAMIFTGRRMFRH